MLKRSALILCGCIFIGLCVYAFLSSSPATIEPLALHPDDSRSQARKIRIGSALLDVEIRDTPALRTRGLSGREGLLEGEGMLFVFETPGIYGFWMKEMKFPIDIIWIDAQKRIVGADIGIEPETYPEVFRPQTDILYVLEVPKGFYEGQFLKQGDMLVFE